MFRIGIVTGDNNLSKIKIGVETILEKCKKVGIDIRKEMIPVTPAAHYLCGGIEVDKNGKTSIANLFACGECTRTGLHGANRLASNSLLEALVYAHNIFKYHVSHKIEPSHKIIPEWNEKGTVIPKEHILIKHNLKELQALMRDYVGIVRSNYRLNKAIKHLDFIYEEVEELYKKATLTTNLCELRNMVNVSHLIIKQSIERKENKGGFYSIGSEIARLEQSIHHAEEMRQRQAGDLEQAAQGLKDIQVHISKDQSQIVELEEALNDLEPTFDHAQQSLQASAVGLQQAQAEMQRLQQSWGLGQSGFLFRGLG